MNKLFYNGDVVTVDEKNTQAEAVWVKDGIIIKVGNNDDLLKMVDESTEKIDLEGKTLMPGFIDPHSHFSNVAKTALLPNIAPGPIGECDSIEQLILILKKYDDETGNKLPYIVGMGYDHEFLKEGRHPNKFDLDKVATDRPVIVMHVSGHVGSANSFALEHIFKFDENTPNPKGGVIDRLPNSNEPSGYLEETAIMEGVLGTMGATPSEEVLTKMIKSGQLKYTSAGVTTAQEGASGDAELDLFKFMAANDLFDIDIYAYPAMMLGEPWINNKEISPGDWIGRAKFAGYKYFLDGSPQARTAWLSKPYEVVSENDDPNYVGVPIINDVNVLSSMFQKAIKDDVQFLVHCNGDASGDLFINAYKDAISKVKPKRALRPVMVHCQTARPDQLDEMRLLGIYPTFFTAHTFFWGDIHRKNFGEERASMISNMRYAIDIGLRYTNHEDSPVLPVNPLLNIWSAVNRITRSGFILGKERKVTPLEALKASTIYGAYQYFEEDRKGSIEVGKLADLVILDKNLLKVDEMKIKDIKVLETIKEGKTIFKA